MDVVAVSSAKKIATTPGTLAPKDDCGAPAGKDNGKVENHRRIIDKTRWKLKFPGLGNELNKACLRTLFMNEKFKKVKNNKNTKLMALVNVVNTLKSDNNIKKYSG
jgi:hypothetical protein